MPDPAPVQTPLPSPTFGEEMQRFVRWCRENVAQAALFAALLGTFVYFFAFHGIFTNGAESAMLWAYRAWNEPNDLEHGVFILPAAMLVVWLHREDFRRAAKAPSWLGLGMVLAGVFAFIVAAWTLQARIALIALPMLIVGCVWFLWGWPTARLVVFPSAILLFMIPIGFVLGHTEPLQRLVAVVVTGLSNLVGVGIDREGVKLIASDGSFKCEVAGGCSGIRSLMAMAMLSAFYGHFTMQGFWKKALLFAMSLPFAVLGNIGRVFTIVLVSKIFGEKWGTGPWHDISGFIITIPIAVTAMLGFSHLLNRDWKATATTLLKPEVPAPTKTDGTTSSSGPISYDY